jgi:drug/metabolite transporter (DMT)-like permease
LNNPHLHKAYWSLVAISFFWGTTWFVSKLTVPHIPALQLTGMRQVAAGVLLLIFFLSKNFRLPSRKEFFFHFICGFLLITCSNGLTTVAIKFIPSFLGALISCLSPFVFVLGGSVFFQEKVNKKVVVGLLIGFSGIGVLLSSFFAEMQHPNFLFGVVLSLVAVFTWTSGTLFSVKNRLQLNPYESIGWQMLFGGVMLLTFSAVSGQYVKFASIPLQAWIYFVYLTFVGSIFCFICYLYALQKLPLSLVSIYVYINPIVALLLGILCLNEKINPTIAIGSIIILVGIFVVKKFSKV